ncbi:3 beta-hydroxysteroid dehydrogenase/Delta 5--_4-isomerase [Drosophila miranda]|uniref:3 beta-hydroxysteroid dehydrogenase/Delta 5-->4-isomerase n=1 Tax=Drosophila miranda TaxID=7229 RepID=UPI0007E887AC|nr:3 beta-hydroxysteroid dehydrogenase/Delta 5-->4-isomerase [Drosophila miranda]XP_033242229.1 3 beta-hydroxysteroid dehydrogenase/Delta 5-->4-isomerase [Drosophila miranda]
MSSSSSSTSGSGGAGDVVLVTGGSGFLGQHLIKQLLERRKELGIREVRSLDIVPYKNNIGHPETSILRTFVGDIGVDRESLGPIFAGVDGVFHCAASVKIEYPPNYEELDRVNVKGTLAIVDLCIQNNVKRLVYTSCTSVCFVPFKGRSTFSAVINSTESKTDTPTLDGASLWEQDSQFLIAGYASSKLRGENIVLNSNGAPLQNQQDYLATCAIRAPLTYGECDSHFVTDTFEYLSTRGWVFPRIAGVGGKQQLVYAGNVAWGHLCAYKALKVSSKAVNGLPVFVTDDTGINDVSRFIQKMALLGERFKVKTSWWYVPHFLFFFLAFLLEVVVRVAYPYTKYRLHYSPRAIASYTSSMLMYNRLRAAIHMDYMPLFDADASAERSAKWYAQWWDQKQQARQQQLKKSS